MLKKISTETKGYLDRYVLLWETDKHSKSKNLVDWFKQHKDYFKVPKIIYCMDSVVPSYDSLYLSRSLKGLDYYDLETSLTVSGLHSGEFGGLIADSFRVYNDLFNRIENPKTGRLPDDFYYNLPVDYY